MICCFVFPSFFLVGVVSCFHFAAMQVATVLSRVSRAFDSRNHFPVVPSLLYFVSGVLEESPAVPLSGLARCFSGVAPYQELLAIRNYVYAEEQNRIVLSTAQGLASGLNSLAEHHGDFDNDTTTRASIQAYLKR